jgi:hypothetical protein
MNVAGLSHRKGRGARALSGTTGIEMGNVLRQDANQPFAGPQEVEGNVSKTWL